MSSKPGSTDFALGPNSPLVSVAIVTYNQKNYLPALLESILHQDYPNIEVIIADDASTDGAQDICRKYGVQYPDRVICLLAKTNAGITANAHAAFQRCTGDFMCPVSGDDIFLPGKISAQVEWFRKNPDAALCGCGVEVFDSATDETVVTIHDPVLRSGGGVGAMIRQSCAIPTSAFMFRKTACRGIKLDYRTPIVSDWLFIIEVCMRGKYGCVEGTYLRYRRHGENTTAYGEERSYIEDRLIYTDILFGRYRKYFFSLKIQRAQILYQHGKRCGYDGKHGRAGAFMIYALCEWPFSMNAISGLVLSSLAIVGVNGWVVARNLAHKLRRVKSSRLPSHH